MYTFSMLHLKHMRERKRKHLSKKSSYHFLDYLVYFASFAGPLMTIPQIMDIWTKKTLAVNEITWGSYVLFAAVWLCYGIAHKEMPIIVSNTLWIIAEGLVVIGAALYR